MKFLSYLPLYNLRNQRSLILFYSLLNIKIKHKGTYLGLIWTALEPALLFILLYTVFTSIHMTTRENFGVYLLTGLILYHAFARGTLSGLTSLRDNYSILTSLNVKKEFFPVVSTFTSTLLMFVEIAVLFGLMPFFQFTPPGTIIFLPILVGLLLVLILGMSYFLSVAYVYLRDIQPFWAIFIHALFFITPIFWSLDNVKGILLTIHSINPVGQIVELGHQLVVFGNIPSLGEWLYVSSLVFIIFIIGFVTFKKLEKRALEAL